MGRKSDENHLRLSKAVVALFAAGSTESELVTHRERLVKIHALGEVWLLLRQSSANRWLREAKDENPDLEVEHVLNRRRRKPGLRRNWKLEGVILLPPFYDAVTDTLYLGPGMGFFPLSDDFNPAHTVQARSDTERALPSFRDRDAVGPYLAHLCELGYSVRDLHELWAGRSSKSARSRGAPKRDRFSAMDREPWVQWNVARLKEIRVEPMAPTTIWAILQVYSTSTAESWRQSMMGRTRGRGK